MNIKHWISLILVFLFVYKSVSQENKIAENALKEDFKIAAKIISSLSPSLSKDDLQTINAQIKTKLKSFDNKPMSCIELLKELSNSGIDYKTDEHGNFTLPGNVLMQQLRGNVLFPIPIKVIDSRLFVNIENSEIPFGAEILKINGYTSKDILTKLTKLDLEDTFELRNIENTFDILFAILIESKEQFEIVYENNKTLTLNGVGLAERDGIYAQRIFPLDLANQKKVLRTQYLNKYDAYYFQLNAFEIPSHFTNNKIHYKEFKRRFDSIFTDINSKKVKHLILDIRNNTGGDAYIPPLLYSYLAKVPFKEELTFKVRTFDLPYKNHLVSIADKSVPDRFDDYLNKVKSTFTKENGIYINKTKDSLREPNIKQFEGKVHLIVGGYTASAGAYFASIFKSEERGLIYGEKVGGSHSEVTAGNMATYELPNSKIKLTIPIMRVYYSDKILHKIPERFIYPDVNSQAEFCIKYFLEKRDFYLSEVINTILNI